MVKFFLILSLFSYCIFLLTVAANTELRNHAIHDIADWSELITPASLSIASLSHLLIARAQLPDFKIDQLDKKKIPLIQDPESFQATLIQIGKESIESFEKARENMLMIQLNTGKIPSYVADCMEYLKSGDKEDVKYSLQSSLDEIKQVAEEGETLSKEVCDSFNRLGQLVWQVIQATAASLRVNKKEITNKIVGEEEKWRAEATRKQYDKIYKSQKKLEEAEEDLTEKKKYLDATRKPNLGLLLVFLGFDIKEKSVLYAREMKIEAEELLKKMEKETEEVQKELKKISEENREALEKLRWDAEKKLNQNETVQILTVVLDYLCKFQEDWIRKKICFSNMKINYKKETLPRCTKFLANAEQVEKDVNGIEQLEKSLQLLLEVCYKTHLTAKMYVQICEKYMLISMNQISAMFTLSPSDLIETQNELIASCADLVDGITKMYNNDRAELIRQMEKNVEVQFQSHVKALANVN